MSAASLFLPREAPPVPGTGPLAGLAVLAGAILAILFYVRIPTSVIAATVPFAPIDGSPASGTLSLAVSSDDRATLVLKVAGLAPGVEYPVHLHSGTPEQPGASLGVLGMLQGAADGTAQLTASSVRGGATGASVGLTGALLADGPRFVDVHAEGAPDAIAVAAIPARFGGSRT